MMPPLPPSCMPRHQRRRPPAPFCLPCWHQRRHHRRHPLACHITNDDAPQHPLVCHVTDDDAPPSALLRATSPTPPRLDYDNCYLPPIFDDPCHFTWLFDGYPHPNDMNAASCGSSTTPHPNKNLALPARKPGKPNPSVIFPPFPFPFFFIYVHVI